MTDQGKIRIERALISTADKEGIANLGTVLSSFGIKILSTNSTFATLSEAGVKCREVSDITRMNETLAGRLKTLHPAVLGGILFDRDSTEQRRQIEEIGAKPIDLVVVNFYPFVQMASTADKLDLTELIDIGGPTMVRSAAKNFRHVVVLTNSEDYTEFIDELQQNNGSISLDTSQRMAKKAFAVTSAYDAAIAASYAGQNITGISSQVTSLLNLSPLNYGENPHQEGWFSQQEKSVRQLGGARLSYNNLQDAVVAWRCCVGFDKACCAIIKHASPCGVAVADNIADAYTNALATDQISAYGGIVACNREIGVDELKLIRKTFCEVIIAPSYSGAATEQLCSEKRIKTLYGPLGEGELDVRAWGQLTLVQSQDVSGIAEVDLTLVSKMNPSEEQNDNLRFAWQVAKSVRSNAVVIASQGRTIGIGAGQSSRVGAAQLAIENARSRGYDLLGKVAASDGFFPFADGLEYLVAAGIKAIVHPGGSRRDKEVIAAADAAGVVLLTTGCRHFSH